MVVEVEHPVAGRIPLVGNPIRMSASPVAYEAAPPLLGQHTEQVLGGLLRLSADEIAALREQSVVGLPPERPSR